MCPYSFVQKKDVSQVVYQTLQTTKKTVKLTGFQNAQDKGNNFKPEYRK